MQAWTECRAATVQALQSSLGDHHTWLLAKSTYVSKVLSRSWSSMALKHKSFVCFTF